MIRRTTALSAWDLLLVVAMAGIAFAAYVAFALPPPKKPKATAAMTPAQAANLAKATEEKLGQAREELKAQVWDMTAEELSAEVQARLNRLAESHQLKLVDFRAGRILASADLWQATFTVMLDGSFGSLLAMLGKLEDPSAKLAIGQLKVSAKNEGDLVTASLVLTGFLARKEETK